MGAKALIKRSSEPLISRIDNWGRIDTLQTFGQYRSFGFSLEYEWSFVMSDPPKLKTRRASSDDFPAIGRLWKAMMDRHQQGDARFTLERGAATAFQRYLHDVLNNYYYAIFVSTIDAEVVGYAIIAEMDNPEVFQLKKYGFICEISVDENRQRRGIGQALFDRAKRWFLRRGLKVVQLNVSPRNREALEFYHKLGFEPFLEILWKDLAPPGETNRGKERKEQ